MTIDVTHVSPERRMRIADIVGEELAARVKASAKARDARMESQSEERAVGRIIASLTTQIERLHCAE